MILALIFTFASIAILFTVISLASAYAVWKEHSVHRNDV